MKSHLSLMYQAQCQEENVNEVGIGLTGLGITGSSGGGGKGWYVSAGPVSQVHLGGIGVNASSQRCN
jgi:hypothetical protein